MYPTSDDERTWILLRERSLQPGGFGEDRTRIWPALLGAQPLSDPPPYSEVNSTDEYENPIAGGMDASVADPHTDERQIKLDTDRSFVLYPGESGAAPARDALQNDLHGLLVSLFRKRRSLHYFQGFHDIMTVLFLTLPRPLHLICAEKMALYRVRDAMGVGLEPVLGLLRVLRNLLRLADPAYARLLENTSPLPYHALSHLLTLFSHDVPTLPLIQHVWDFLLSREPIAVVWLAAAFILHRKLSIYLLAEQDEEGMIHSLLGGMPELIDAEPDFCNTGDDNSAQVNVTEVDCAAENGTPSGSPVGSPDLDGERTGAHKQPVFETVNGIFESVNISEQTRVSRNVSTEDEIELNRNLVSSNVIQSNDTLLSNISYPGSDAIPVSETMHENCVLSPNSSILELAASTPVPDSRTPSDTIPEPLHPVQPSMLSSREAGPVDYHSPSSSALGLSQRSRLPSSDLAHPSTLAQSPLVANEPTTHVDKPIKTRIKPAPLSLTRLLRQADDLLTAYPPSHPSLRVAEIMGPDSAMRTWRPMPITASTRHAVIEKQPYSETDDYLETLVSSSHIVIPSPPPSPSPGPRSLVRKIKVSPRSSSRVLLDPRRIGLRLGALTPAERRMLFMGALLVVGAAVALKSSKIPCVDGIVKVGASGGDGLKRLWNGKWTIVSSVVAAWGRGLP